eukprot:gene495-931_t
MADALEVDPSTCRTIPVITKPDLIDEGAKGGVVDLLLGRKTHDFSLGFHIVKCRGQKALDEGMDIQEGKKLADIQIQMMNETIPQLRKEVIQLRDDAENELASLGIDANSSDTTHRQTFTDYIEMLKSQISNTEFADAILSTRLNNVSTLQVGSNVVVTSPISQVSCKGKIFKMEEGYCLVESIDPAFNDICYENIRGVNFSNKKVGMKLSVPNSTKYMIVKEITSRSACIKMEFKQIEHHNIIADTSWLSELFLKNKGRHLQVFLNADVFNSIIADFIKKDWLPLCQSLLSDISYAILDFLSNIFKRFPLSSFPEFNRWMEDRTRKNINKARNKRLFDAIDELALIERNERMSCHQHILQEIEITLNAYGKVAAKCAIDLFPKQIDTNLLDPFQSTIHQSLHRTDAELKVLLAESQPTVRKRTELLQKIETMNATEAAFHSFLNISF